MKFLIVVLLALFAAVAVMTTPLTPNCPENEFWNTLATCDDTCLNPNAHWCKKPYRSRCSCIEGFVRVIAKGACIPLASCPPKAI